MKFPRNAKIIRSHFDVAPFAAVFFIVLIFFLLGMLLPVPGIQLTTLQPPAAENLPGTDRPTVAMAIDSQGRLFFENQAVSEAVLRTSLSAAAKSAPAALTLIIHADKSVSYEILAHLALLAREPQIGITNILLATLPPTPNFPAQP